jgi:transglutaminase-like putative cysteine protease
VVAYRITHRTEYRYGTAVSGSQTIAHLRPRTTEHQVVRTSELWFDPVHDHAHEHLDAFGNLASYRSIERPHDRLTITAVSEVEVTAPADADSSMAWDAPGGLTSHYAVFALPSPLVPIETELARYAAQSFAPGRRLVDAVVDLNHRIFSDFEFDPGVTDVSTPVTEVLRLRRGVCQDFAHLLLGCLRSKGLAARYVSGYLETDPPPGGVKLIGADASHAWCSVWVGDHGWLDLDPTNDQVPSDRHVTVAWGRDYGDVAPVRGVVFGPKALQELAVSVDVVRL